MKKEKPIQADIEVKKPEPESMMSLKANCSKADVWNTCYHQWKLYHNQEMAKGKQALEAMRDAEMPEKKGCEGHGYNYSNFCGGCHKAKSRNETIDLCQPIVSKLLKENKELRKKIKELENA